MAFCSSPNKRGGFSFLFSFVVVKQFAEKSNRDAREHGQANVGNNVERPGNATSVGSCLVEHSLTSQISRRMHGLRKSRLPTAFVLLYPLYLTWNK